MVLNSKRCLGLRHVILPVLLILIASAAAYGKETSSKSAPPGTVKNMDQNEWKKVLEAARIEGKLVISGDPSEVWRKSLVDLFRQEYPYISVEYTGINGRDFWPRIRQERELGQKLWDLRTGGTQTAYEGKAAGFLDPIRPLLLPEIADDSKWFGGLDGLFYDKEKKYLPAYSLYIQRTTFINRDFIKESEIKSSGQLLDPKFKGKIVMQNPTGGATFFALCNMSFMYGANFLRDLLTKQNVIVTDDKRQQAEWVVRGKYPIAIGFNDTQLVPFVKQGLGKNVTELEDKIIPVATGLGGIALLKDAPHPNTAKVYINWLLTKNTQTKLSKNVLLNSSRTDVPPVVKELAVDPVHLNSYYLYATEENVELSNRLLPLIKESLRK